MLRKIIHIDEDKCTGCGICVDACHEGAIGLVDGKARLLRDDYCDGLGDCLPACPTGAITFEEREAAAYDAAAVAAKTAASSASHPTHAGGCPSARAQTIAHAERAAVADAKTDDSGSMLGQWPVQIRLVSSNAGFLNGADLLIAADCTAFSCGDFHQRFLAGRVPLVGCPKLDPVDYTEKLTEIISNNDIRSITVVLMEVPCCAGLGSALNAALAASGKDIPCNTFTVMLDGRII
jgi:NAD-dependent dihydropyrimidine dehydrogenase PreA subunit